MALPAPLKRNLRSKENGHDVIGVTISVGAAKRVIKTVKGWFIKRKKERRPERKGEKS